MKKRTAAAALISAAFVVCAVPESTSLQLSSLSAIRTGKREDRPGYRLRDRHESQFNIIFIIRHILSCMRRRTGPPCPVIEGFPPGRQATECQADERGCRSAEGRAL